MKTLWLMAGANCLASVAVLSAPAAANPFYANIETNLSHHGTDSKGQATDFHLGVEGSSDVYSAYLQAGPALMSADGGDLVTEFSGKVGGAVQASERMSVYGELAMLTDQISGTPSYGTKIGAKYKF